MLHKRTTKRVDEVACLGRVLLQHKLAFSTRKTPFEIVYGRSPPRLLDYIPGTAKLEAVECELLARDRILKEVREHISLAQARMKKLYDSKHIEREFQVGDFVYLKLQPYRQSSVALRINFKLSARYYGPFEVFKRIGKVAYQLKLPPTSKIHPVFHVSQLKKKLGEEQVVLPTLPEINSDDSMMPTPQAVLGQRVRKQRKEVLIHWQGLSPAEATWEQFEVIKERFPEFILEDDDRF